MKILLATESYWPNRDGGAVFERALVLGLAGLGHEVRVVAPSVDGRASKQKDGPSQIYRVRSYRVPGRYGKNGARASLRPGRAIEKIITDWTPDVIHGHNPFGIGRATQNLARARRIPYVATNHNMPENTLYNLPLHRTLWRPGVIERLWQWQMGFLNRANFVTSPTQTAVDMLLAHGLAIPHRAISNGVDLARFQPGTPDRTLAQKYHLPSKPLVLYLGRLDTEKRLDVWLQSVPLIRRELDAHFVLGGRGGERAALERQAAALGVKSHVTFTGGVDEADLPAFYRLGSVFAIASPAELQSIVTLEAMASGLPIVACDAAALPELCKSGRNGYLFLSGDPAGLAKSTVRILRNPGMAEKMGAESRRIVEQSHDVQRTPQQYLEVYQEVTGAPAA